MCLRDEEVIEISDLFRRLESQHLEHTNDQANLYFTYEEIKPFRNFCDLFSVASSWQGGRLTIVPYHIPKLLA